MSRDLAVEEGPMVSTWIDAEHNLVRVQLSPTSARDDGDRLG
jgi:hypothetical protein